MIDTIANRVFDAKHCYHRLVLLVDENDDHLSLKKQISKRLSTEPLNVNLELSKRLLNLTQRDRQLYLERSLREIAKGKELLLLDHIEMLFDPSLNQDPLRLLESLSRNQTVAVFWRGKIKDGRVIYAKAGHPEYRSYNINDLMVIKIEEGER